MIEQNHIPHMTYQQHRTARRLVHECCNYVNGNCLALDNPDIDELLKYLANLKVRMMGQDVHFVCGYEAGCLGYSLYHQLTRHKYKCVIICLMML